MFQTIVENQYILKSVSGSVAESISSFAPKNANNRTLENGTKKGLETDLSPNVLKNSADCTTLELFITELYNKITDINTTCIFNQIENLKHLA